MLVSCFYQHASLPLHRTLSGDTPKRKHFPQPQPQQPPTNPDICHFPAPLSPPPSAFHACFVSSLSMSVKIDQFTGRKADSGKPPTCTLKRMNLHTGLTARDPALLTEVEGEERGGGGGMTKTTACVGEHCLRLRLEIFSGKTGFYTQWSWV